MKAVRIWDLPTRLFHWLLAATIIGLIVTGKVGGNAMIWHIRLGYAVFALLLFRLLWGFVGGYWSRFATFLPTRSRWARYVEAENRTGEFAGHTPLGALSVFAMLIVFGAQLATGLFADDEIAFSGPLTALVSSDTVYSATDFHKDIGQWLVIVLTALHVLAIAFYRVFRKKPLTRAMVVGDQLLSEPTRASRDTAVTRLQALVLLCLAAAIVYWVVQLGNSS